MYTEIPTQGSLDVELKTIEDCYNYQIGSHYVGQAEVLEAELKRLKAERRKARPGTIPTTGSERSKYYEEEYRYLLRKSKLLEEICYCHKEANKYYNRISSRRAAKKRN